MIRGMTGFGTAPVSSGGARGVVEIKSQNHRYFDIVFYLPIGFSSLEDKIRQLINKDVKRGRVTVSVKITEKPLQSLSFNKGAVKGYLQYAKILKREYKLDNNLTLADLIKMPGVIQARETMLRPEQMWPGIRMGLKKSTASLLSMRKREGKSLTVDVSGVLRRMLLQIKTIQSRAKILLREKKKKLTQDEFLSFQKSNDINEELARLTHYVQEFKLLLKSSTTVGKKLDFVAQEMQRETNTIGAKLQDKTVANAVIALKSKIEKLREQAQNIE